ncbi:hypothetical protein HB904_04055 [Listeria booriae]|uniref:Uncharacterized protein n=1 Tax=Listeria booriae TaxID=1552123 RepID=A0A842A8Z1_9LIST|nr:hypothetical protein [Listeria booriae]MBC1615346.1 hypothetical protein [Listeria booriae]
MKTSEFKATLNELNLKYYVRNGEWIAHDETYYDLISVSVDCQFAMKITKHAYEVLNAEQVAELYELVTAYASTPLDEREEPRLYYIQCPITKMYLNQETQDDDSFLWTTSKRETSDYRTKFTRAEIEAYDLEHLIEEEVPNNER